MTDLQNKYAQLLELMSTTSAKWAAPLKIYTETPQGKIYLDNPGIAQIFKKEMESWDTTLTFLSKVFKDQNRWKEFRALAPTDPNIPLYNGALGFNITYRQCHDITDAFVDFDKAPSLNFSALLILRKAEQALRSLAPVDRYWATAESIYTSGLDPTMTVNSVDFPALATYPQMIMDADNLYELANAHHKGLALIDDIHLGLSPVTSHLLQEPKWARTAAPKVL